MMYTLDANIFVRDVNASEPDHDICHTLIEQLRATSAPIVIPLIILAEVAGSVSRSRRDSIRARVFVDILRELPNVTLVAIDDTLAQEAADIAADHYLRGADAIYVAVARRYACTLVSLDREQRERAAAIVTTRTPAEALAELHPPASESPP